MAGRVFRLGPSVVGLALVAAVAMGLAVPACASAAVKHKPVVTAVRPTAGPRSGGNTVTIAGKNFRRSGKCLVKKVMFGSRRATHVHVKRATSITVTVPAGTGTVNVRVTTLAGTSARVSADKYTYVAPAAKYIVTSSSYAPVAGTAVAISAQLASASNSPVHGSGVEVTWSTTGAGGSFSSATSTTNAGGIARVMFTTSASVGTSYAVTALDGSSLTGTSPTITTADKALEVEYNDTPVRAYSLAELEAMTPFAGNAGFRKITGTIIGPEAVTGVKVTRLVADALGTPLADAESVDVASVPPFSPYSMNFSYDRLVNLAGFTMYDATTKNPVANSSLTGPLAAVLVYSDPGGLVMPPASGPLRLMVADATSENVVMSPSSDSVYQVNQLNVIDPRPVAHSRGGRSGSAPESSSEPVRRMR